MQDCDSSSQHVLTMEFAGTCGPRLTTCPEPYEAELVILQWPDAVLEIAQLLRAGCGFENELVLVRLGMNAVLLALVMSSAVQHWTASGMMVWIVVVYMPALET